jgi:hypothetical protein
MNEELTPPEGPRRGRKPSDVAKREKLNTLIAKIREKKAGIDKNSQSK